MRIYFDQSGVHFGGGPSWFHRAGNGGDSSADGFQGRVWETKAADQPAKPAVKAVIPALLLTLVFAAIWYYLEYPALNVHSGGFWRTLILFVAVYVILFVLFGGLRTGSSEAAPLKKRCAVPLGLIGLLIGVMLIGSATGWVLFRAGAYARLLEFRTGDFAEDVAEVQWNQIPMLDSASANTLANRKLGELSDLVSQFEVDGDSAQINYQGSPVRVTYLDYGDIIKWWNNRSEGIPAYIVTDMQTQAVKVVRLEEGIRYSPSELFNRKISRHLQFCYPTALFGDINFEIDEDGTPWWVASVEKKRIGLFSGTDIQGAVLCNAVTGACEYYDVADIPTWVDRVYDADILMEQYNYYGSYHNGFFNSIFGQKDCTVTTSGYNYIAMDDDVWLYTGITSVGGDESNIGFILVNQRTKEAAYYSCAGAEEYSGMSSAEGAVQQYSYVATFPLLLNIGGEPTYFMALKDDSQLVKMYAMVNVHEYQIVATGNNVESCLNAYQTLLAQNGIVEEESAPEAAQASVTGEITEIRSAVIDGNTTFYLQLEDGDCYYVITAADAPETVLLNVGDPVTIVYTDAEDDGMLRYAASVTRQAAAAASAETE